MASPTENRIERERLHYLASIAQELRLSGYTVVTPEDIQAGWRVLAPEQAEAVWQAMHAAHTPSRPDADERLRAALELLAGVPGKDSECHYCGNPDGHCTCNMGPP